MEPSRSRAHITEREMTTPSLTAVQVFGLVSPGRWWAHTLTSPFTSPPTVVPSRVGGVGHPSMMTGSGSAATAFRLLSGEAVVTRPLQRHDRTALAAAVARMSDASRYHRFHQMPADIVRAGNHVQAGQAACRCS
jgi:hypothetical protein